MTSEPPTRAQRRLRDTAPAGSETGDEVLHNILELLTGHIGGGSESKTATLPSGRRSARGPKVDISIDYSGNEPRTIHNMAGGIGYSLTSNWFAQYMAKLLIAGLVSKSQAAVFLFVAGGQEKGTGITSYTQQQITDGLNEFFAAIPGAKRTTRPTVNKAVKSLCEWGWLESAGYGRIRLNVTLWFSGNSGEQQTVLQEIAEGHGHDPRAFPHKVGPTAIPGQQVLDFGEPPHARGVAG
ncbi:hypothetical protein ACFWBI_30480 [Streptomyces sp. NPDC059982]|uniref:hypothetical protein n=1 Tax=unclassified Streptomyces TaxID=2593676 RepID=UPI00367F6E0D